MTTKNEGTAPVEEHRHLVKIEVDGKPFEVPPGPMPVAKLKAIAGVPAADDLNIVRENGRLDPLPDDGTVNIHAGMKFVSTPKTGGSS